MRKPILTLILAVSVPWALPAQQREGLAKDPGGWNKAKWGMTVEQVLQVFKGQAKPIDGCRVKPGSPPVVKVLKECLAEIEDIEIEWDHFRVDFRFDVVTKQLDIITVEPVGDQYAWSTRAEKLERTLTEKYGQPAYRKNTDQRFYKGVDCTWVFPQTKIGLLGAYSPLPQLERKTFLLVIYTRRDQESEKL